ncbi:MAG: SDR family oxidoreductase [Candidatus Omnitrophica bacterium]|nr:SDR family oxidoreductase [Candidatus Omnitrophota bacterium]
MGEKVILTGAGGFVGGIIFSRGSDRFELHGISSKTRPMGIESDFWHSMNLQEDFSSLEKFMQEIRPGSLIHAAAMADIDACEKDPELAWRINVELAEKLVHLCEACQCRLVYLSTDTVFDGEQGGYREHDSPSPVNFYGKTKQAAEQIVSGSKIPWAIARLCLVMGFSTRGEGNSFLDKMESALLNGREVGCPDNEIRSPIDVQTLAEAILELAGNDLTGIFHLAGTEKLTRYEMGRRIAARLGYDPALVVVKNADAIPGRAPRPRDVSLNQDWTRSQLTTRFKGIEEGIDYLLQLRTH